MMEAKQTQGGQFNTVACNLKCVSAVVNSMSIAVYGLINSSTERELTLFSRQAN
jgi:hypothetical protein